MLPFDLCRDEIAQKRFLFLIDENKKKSMAVVQNLWSELSFVLPEEDKNLKHYRRFNNSLVHYKDDIYLMSYRLILIKKSHIDKFDVPTSVRHHPWTSHWERDVDIPVLAVLKENKTGFFTVMREFRFTFPEKLKDLEYHTQDIRMVKLQDKVYAYGQFILKHDELSKLNAFGAKMNKPL